MKFGDGYIKAEGTTILYDASYGIAASRADTKKYTYVERRVPVEYEAELQRLIDKFLQDKVEAI